MVLSNHQSRRPGGICLFGEFVSLAAVLKEIFQGDGTMEITKSEEKKQFSFSDGGAGYITCPHCRHEQYHGVYWLVDCHQCGKEIRVVDLYE
jgi:ribosomal protein S27E